MSNANSSGPEHKAVEPSIERKKAMLTATLFELWDTLRRARQRRRAHFQLQALDDRLLKDIGLHRSGIDAAVESALQAREAKRRPGERAAPQPMNGACAIFGETTP